MFAVARQLAEHRTPMVLLSVSKLHKWLLDMHCNIKYVWQHRKFVFCSTLSIFSLKLTNALNDPRLTPCTVWESDLHPGSNQEYLQSWFSMLVTFRLSGWTKKGNSSLCLQTMWDYAQCCIMLCFCMLLHVKSGWWSLFTHK